jgi:hypothetical protein
MNGKERRGQNLARVNGRQQSARNNVRAAASKLWAGGFRVARNAAIGFNTSGFERGVD